LGPLLYQQVHNLHSGQVLLACLRGKIM
jgi:hypothetical protein